MRHHSRSGTAFMVAAIAISLVAAAGCGEKSADPTAASSAGSKPGGSQIALTRKADTMLVDQTIRLVAVSPAAPGKTASASPVWSSSDTSVAVVMQNGLVFALKSGSAVISVTDQGTTDATKLTVRPSIRSLSFDADSLALGLNQSVALPYRAIDSDGNVVKIAQHKVEWVSTAPDIAPISSGDTVTGRTLGVSDVRLTVDGKLATTRVHVRPTAVSSVTVSPAAPAVGIGEQIQLSALVADASGAALNRSVTWSTSSPSVATISSTGMLTGVAAGTAKITATSGNKRGSVTVSVAQAAPPAAPAPVPVFSVSLTLNASTLSVGQTTQATATLKDSASHVLTDRTVSWTSSDESIASVSASGLVSALRAGSAVITASAEGKSANAVIVVAAPAPVPSTITVTLDQSTIPVGSVARATAVVRDANAAVISSAVVNWSSTPTSVATISVNGAALGRSIGTASISASIAGITQSVKLTVVDSTTAPPPVTPPAPTIARVVVTLPASTLTVGAKTQATASAYDANGALVTGASMVWATSNQAIASVGTTGLVSAVGQGTASISASAGGQVGSAIVTVNPAPSQPSGVPVSPGQSIQSAVNANPAGTTFIIKAGTHTGQSVVPKSGDTFIGEAGAILDGGTQLAAFTRGSAPYPSNVTIRGLEIRNYGPTSSSADFYGDAAITGGGNASSDGTRGWVVDSNYIHDNRGMGLRIGHRMLVRGNRIIHNAGPHGLGGIGDSTTIDGNEIATSNYNKTFSPGFSAGGFKIVMSTGVVIRNNWIHGNWGFGAWGDIANRNMTFDGNTVEDNSHAGIFYEISYGCKVVNNTVRRNGSGDGSNWFYPAGILIAHSPDCEVANNTVTQSIHGIVGIQQNRTDDMLYGAHTLKNLWVHDNTVQGASGYTVGVGADYGNPFDPALNNKFDRNHYTATTANPFAWSNATRTWSGWRGYGLDVNGTFTAQ
jgi:parallel beta-helix repeat protein